MIRKCGRDDEEAVFHTINEAAKVYRGVIPDDRYREPYMALLELRKEMGEMTFFGYEEQGKLVGVAGWQEVGDVTLVRHVYVLPDHQRRGIGTELLNHIMRASKTPQILVGTWKAATWAISFYQKHGFKLLPNKDELLRKYWTIPKRQIQLSVVLGTTKPRSLARMHGIHRLVRPLTLFRLAFQVGFRSGRVFGSCEFIFQQCETSGLLQVFHEDDAECLAPVRVGDVEASTFAW